MHTPKQRTERLLASRHVHQEYIEVPADHIWFALARRYAPDVPIELYWPERFRNPLVTSRFPGVSLRVALEDVARYCGVEMSVSDYGSIVLGQPSYVEVMRHAVVIEPDRRDWQKVWIQTDG